MGNFLLKKLKIGYWPISSDFNSAGDRRRLIFWAQSRGHTVTTDLNQNLDVIVVTAKGDLNSKFWTTNKVPVIFDLVDAYLSPSGKLEDFGRSIAKSLNGELSGFTKYFSKRIEEFCKYSRAVICSSIEQEVIIRTCNRNTHVILDSHEEIPWLSPGSNSVLRSFEKHLFWEGQPATLRGLKVLSSAFQEIQKRFNVHLNLITDSNYFLLLNSYLKRDTLSLVRRNLRVREDFLHVVPWSTGNLTAYAQKSSLGVIPVDISIPSQRLKPENRLLIMWRLGLPALTSPTPAYLRVSLEAGTQVICHSSDEWRENLMTLLNDNRYARAQVVQGQDYLRANHSRDSLLRKWDYVIQSVIG